MRILLLLSLVLLAACGGASAAAKPLVAGQPARLGDLAITYSGAHVVTDTSSMAPNAGQQFLAVALTIVNHAASATRINALTFAVVDKDGRRWLQGFVTPATGQPGIDGVLPAGETVRGAIVVAVPIAGAPYRLRYTRPGTTQTATWAISLP